MRGGCRGGDGRGGGQLQLVQRLNLTVSQHHTQAHIQGTLARRISQSAIVADGDTIRASQAVALCQVTVTVVVPPCSA